MRSPCPRVLVRVVAPSFVRRLMGVAVVAGVSVWPAIFAAGASASADDEIESEAVSESNGREPIRDGRPIGGSVRLGGGWPALLELSYLQNIAHGLHVELAAGGMPFGFDNNGTAVARAGYELTVVGPRARQRGEGASLRIPVRFGGRYHHLKIRTQCVRSPCSDPPKSGRWYADVSGGVRMTNRWEQHGAIDVEVLGGYLFPLNGAPTSPVFHVVMGYAF